MSQSTLLTKLPESIEFKIFEATPGVGLVLLPDAPKYTIVAVTNDFVRTSGMTRDQVIGKGNFEVFPQSPDDPNFTGEKNVKESYAYVIQHKVPHEMPLQRYDIPNGDGTFSHRYWQICNAPVIGDTGEVRYIVGKSVDITENVQLGEVKAALQKLQNTHAQLQESEDKYRTLFATMEQGYCTQEAILDESGRCIDYRFLEVNPAFEGQTGIQNAQGKTIRELVPGIEPYWFPMVEKVIKTGKPIRIEEESKALQRWWDVYMYRIGKTGSQIVGVFFTDITKRILAEQALRLSEGALEKKVQERTRELEKLNQELRRSNQNLEEFAYAASHDMKEPIRKIHFFADRLKERLVHKLGDEDRRYFERLEAGAKRMNTLIDDLLLYSHVNRGLSTVETVDLNQVLSFVLDDLELHIEEKRATVEIGPLPTIKGRPRQLQQLFENLLGNALKYSKEGVVPVIRLAARLVRGSDSGGPAAAVDANKEYHLVEVQDNGIGFDQADAERIFTVFTRLHGNTEYRGTGVGLSIAQKVVQNHGGYIWAESTPGNGATFKLLLPAE